MSETALSSVPGFVLYLPFICILVTFYFRTVLFFIEEILKCKSLSIVGLEKNTGKTECLNYILRQIKDSGKTIALTSIGTDGESRDQVCQTPKPEIEVFEGMLFVTSERYYREKRFLAEILDIGERQTALGRLVTAKALWSGKVLLSGPPDTAGMKQMIDRLEKKGVDLTLVDGALSRLSHGSPAVSEAIVLATGAALSGNVRELVRRTKYVYDLICLEEVCPEWNDLFQGIKKGIWAIDRTWKIHDLQLPSVFMLEKYEGDIFRYGHTLYVSGAVSDKLLQFLRMQKEATELVVQDFTRIFALPETFYAFLKKGGRIKVLKRSRLLAVCMNPQSPTGYCLSSDQLKKALEESLKIPVYDVRRMGN